MSKNQIARLKRREADRLQACHDKMADSLSLLGAWQGSDSAGDYLVAAMLKLSDAIEMLQDEADSILGPDEVRS